MNKWELFEKKVEEAGEIYGHICVELISNSEKDYKRIKITTGEGMVKDFYSTCSDYVNEAIKFLEKIIEKNEVLSQLSKKYKEAGQDRDSAWNKLRDALDE